MNPYPYSVIIPSVGRKSLLRAVTSVITQTIPPQEVIVVGHNLPKTDLLNLDFPGLRIIETLVPQAAGKNRQDGTSLVQTPYIAYLDDDDYWLPEKTEKQFEIMSGDQDLILYNCRARIKSNFGEFDWPRKLIKENVSVIEYLFGDINFMPGDRFFPTTGYFMKTDIALKLGWQEIEHDDWDFIFRAQAEGMKFVMHADTLVVIDQRGSGSSRSGSNPWPSRFLTMHSQQMTREELRNFLAGVTLQRALNSGSWLAVLKTLIKILELGFWKKSTLVAMIRVLRIRNVFRIRKIYLRSWSENIFKAFDSGTTFKKS